MASSDQTLGDRSQPFEVDTTERTHTIVGIPGGVLYNIGLAAGGGADGYVDENAATITTGDGGSTPLPVGASLRLPVTCAQFTAATSASNTYFKLVKE